MDGKVLKVINIRINELRFEALKAEEENKKTLLKEGIDNKTKELIADKQYWNGYLDALHNVKETIKKLII
jgi:hypothetical protein